MDPEDLPSADKAEQKSIFCQPCKRAEEFTKAQVYCKTCATKFCSSHQKVCDVIFCTTSFLTCANGGMKHYS